MKTLIGPTSFWRETVERVNNDAMQNRFHFVEVSLERVSLVWLIVLFSPEFSQEFHRWIYPETNVCLQVDLLVQWKDYSNDEHWYIVDDVVSTRFHSIDQQNLFFCVEKKINRRFREEIIKPSPSSSSRSLENEEEKYLEEPRRRELHCSI